MKFMGYSFAQYFLFVVLFWFDECYDNYLARNVPPSFYWFP